MVSYCIISFLELFVSLCSIWVMRFLRMRGVYCMEAESGNKTFIDLLCQNYSPLVNLKVLHCQFFLHVSDVIHFL